MGGDVPVIFWKWSGHFGPPRITFVDVSTILSEAAEVRKEEERNEE